MTLAASLQSVLLDTVRDVAPLVAVLAFFQLVVVRRRVPNLGRVAAGLALVVVGLTLFLVGLESALFPVGRSMAEQLAAPAFIGAAGPEQADDWWRYHWLVLFGASVGFAATIAEPALLAVGLKAQDVSGGTVRAWQLRIVIAVGVSVSVALSTVRIVAGIPLLELVVAGYALVLALTLTAPKPLVPLAYDSGGVTTSTVTVPIVTALGLGLASTVPGRSELEDGFGLIALAALSPMITVLGYAQLSALRARRSRVAP
jgi:hypothetical protein